jgi:hypothetical protein
MTTLYLSAPIDKNSATALHKDFATIVAESKGPEYAIARKWLPLILPGMKAVVFNRPSQKRAEGTVVSVTPTGQKTPQGILRYDVFLRDVAEVRYIDPPGVDRFGVSVV